MTMWKEEGFTLLEVLVATAIMALAFGALFPIFSTSYERVAAIGARQEAMEVAFTALDIAMIEQDWLNLLKSGEEGNWNWKVESTSPTAEQLNSANGFTLVLTAVVSHKTHQRLPEVKLTKVVWVSK